ncbi:hypothetical protein WJX82_008964 [Trebouxia sp. C0006]
MLAQSSYASRRCLPRSNLQLATRLTLAGSGSIQRSWAAQESCRPCKRHAQRHSLCCRASEQSQSSTLRSVAVHLAVQDGDTLESLSLESGFSKAKLQEANGGDPYLTAGQNLEFVIKVPENMMPVSKNRRLVLVPVEAAYSDDEQEVVVAQENRQVQQEERAEQQRLAQQEREQSLQQQRITQQAREQQAQQRMIMEAGPAMRANVVQTARFFGSTFGNIVVAAGVMGLLWTMLNFRIERVTDSDSDTDAETDTGRAVAAGSRLEDPKVRAEMERRHGRSFLDHLDLEHAIDEAEEEPFRHDPPEGTSQSGPQQGHASTSPQPHWADLETVYFAVNEDGEPMNCLIPQDQEQQGGMQQCVMVFQNSDDLAVLLGIIRAMTDQSLTGVGCYPLTLLQEAEQSERAVAFYRDGVIAHANHIKDEVKWMEHVITLSEVLVPSDIREILASGQAQLQEEKRKAQQASTAKAQAADTAAPSNSDASDEVAPEAAADVHANADVDSDAHVDSDADVESDADVDSVGVRMTGPASNRGGDDLTGSREGAQHSGVHPNGSDRAASSSNGASSSNSSPESVQGDNVYEARANAYAEAGIASDGSSIGSKQQEDIRRPAEDSWKKLSHVCVPFVDYRDGDSALITMKLGTSDNLSEHMLGFESRSDAEELRYLFQANMDEAEAMVHIVPMPPSQIAEMATEQDLAVTVYAHGELRLKPGMTVDQLQEAAAEVFENFSVS